MDMEKINEIKDKLINRRDLNTITFDEFKQAIMKLDDLRTDSKLFSDLVDVFGPQVIELYLPGTVVDVGNGDNVRSIFKLPKGSLKKAYDNQALYRKVIGLGYEFKPELIDSNPQLATTQIMILDNIGNFEKWKNIPEERLGKYLEAYNVKYDAEFMKQVMEVYGQDYVQYYRGIDEELIKLKIQNDFFSFVDLYFCSNSNIEIEIEGQKYDLWEYVFKFKSEILKSQINISDEMKYYVETVVKHVLKSKQELLESLVNITGDMKYFVEVIKNDADLRKDAKLFEILLEFLPPEIIELYNPKSEYFDRFYDDYTLSMNSTRNTESKENPIFKAIEKGYEIKIELLEKDLAIVKSPVVLDVILKSKEWEKLSLVDTLKYIKYAPAQVKCNQDLFKNLVKIHGIDILEEYEGYNFSFIDELIKDGLHVKPRDLIKWPRIAVSKIVQEQITEDLLKVNDLETAKSLLNFEEGCYLDSLSFLKSNDEIMKHLISLDSSFIEFYDGKSNEVFEKALEEGYVVTLQNYKENPSFNKCTAMLRACFENLKQNNYILPLQDMTPDKIDELSRISLFKEDAVMEDLVSQIDPQYLELYSGSTQNIIDIALDNGYKYNPERTNVCKSLLKNDKFRSQYLEGKIKNIYEYLSETDIAKLKHILGIASDFKKLNKIAEYLGPDIIRTLGVNTVVTLLRYSINHEEIKDLLMFVKEGKLESFSKFFQIIDFNIENEKGKGIDKFLKSIIIFKNYPVLVKEIQTKINDGESLSEEEINNLRYLLNNDNKERTLFTLEDLRNLSQFRKKEFVQKYKSSDKISLKKDALFEYLLGKDSYDIKIMLSSLINTMSLTYMIQDAEKIGNKSIETEARYMFEIINVIEELNQIEDIAILDKFASIIQNLPNNQVQSVISLFDNIDERVRGLYEREANSQLTDITTLVNNPEFCQEREFVIESDDKTIPPKIYKAKVVDLSHSEHTVYTHVYTKYTPAEFFSKVDGHQIMSVSVQTDKNEAYYRNSVDKIRGVRLVFSNIPKGNFILSSISNIGSNMVVKDNEYEVEIDEIDEFYSTPIRESFRNLSNKAKHSETLIYRDGMIPTGIVLSGEIPTEEEIKVKEEFEYEIEKMIGKKVELPFVKMQGICNRVYDYRQKVSSKVDFEKNNQLEDRIKILRKLFDLGDKTQIKGNFDYVENVKRSESDDVEHFHYVGYTIIDDQVFLVRKLEDDTSIELHNKRLAATRIQELVHGENVAHGMDVRTITVTNQDGITESYEAIKNDSARSMMDYTRDNGLLSNKSYSIILNEFMVDHLLCNYYSNNEAFLLDEFQEVYGICKENSFSAMEDFFGKDGKPYTGMSYYFFDSSRGNNFYRKVFTEFISSQGEEVFSEVDFENFRETARKISEIPDEEYLKNFEELLNESTIGEEEREKIIKTILARKGNIVHDSEEFIERIKMLREIEKVPEVFENPDKIAFINDIHGNMAALESLLEDCKNSGRTDVFVLGDMIGFGPQSEEALDLLKKYRNELNIRTLLGNHELYCIMGEASFDYRNGHEVKQTQDIRRNMSDENRRYIETMPLDRRIIIGDKKVELTHFPHMKTKNDTQIFGMHGKRDFSEVTSGKNQDYLIYGHEHRTIHTSGDEVGSVFQQEVNGTQFMNLPSSGCVHGKKTSYTILKQNENGELVPEVIAVEYDRDRTISAIDRQVNNNGFDSYRFFGD